MNRREFLSGAIATTTAAGLPITGAIALADAVKTEGALTAAVPFGPVMYGPSFDVQTVVELRANIESMLAFRPYYGSYDDESAAGFGLAKDGAAVFAERWTGNVFSLGWSEVAEAVEDNLYDEPRMIGKACRVLAMAVSAWVEKDDLRGKEAVWRRNVLHRREGSLLNGSIQHIISFRIAVKV